MMKSVCSAVFVIFAFLSAIEAANASASAVPEPFRRFDATSTYTISYADLDAVFKTAVVDVGRSNREKAAPKVAKTGTRVTSSVKRSTINEGNRFYFEIFKDDQANQRLLAGIVASLEQVPAEVPLEYFSRDEQLAYWLNLYNVTVLNEIVKVYPQRKLEKLLVGKNSILSKKLLTIAGIPLSLNDIQFTILKENYDNNPLIMYGLYQGIIGGPNIRRRAYTGENVYRYLRDNAVEFVNSNRGTYAKNAKVFRVSSLYQRNRAYFANFQSDLTKHLLSYLEGAERVELQAAASIKPDIEDWTVTDVYGTYREAGGSLASNSAALIGAFQNTMVVDGGAVTSIGAVESASLVAKSPSLSRFSPELLLHLKEISAKQQAAAATKDSTVTIEELGTVAVDPAEKNQQ